LKKSIYSKQTKYIKQFNKKLINIRNKIIRVYKWLICNQQINKLINIKVNLFF
jgi:hypothetical protein